MQTSTLASDVRLLQAFLPLLNRFSEEKQLRQEVVYRFLLRRVSYEDLPGANRVFS